MKRAALVALIALALSACATPETRVRTALMDAGLSQPIGQAVGQNPSTEKGDSACGEDAG